MEGRSWRKVVNSPLNTSKTKMLFSFSRTKRFGSTDSRSSSNSCDRFYDLPPLIGRNAAKASIGFGKKDDMVQRNVVAYPSPNKYSIKSIFDDCKKGYGFRLGRQKLKEGSIFQISKTPGPGTYQTKTHRLTPEITLKPRLKELHDSSYTSPGPGTYNIPKYLADNGKYFLSTMKNASTPALKSVHSTSRKQEPLPGPGSYESKENFNPNGTYFNSKFHNSGTRSFGKVQRERPLSKHVPNIGPGAYELPTDFGGKERA